MLLSRRTPLICLPSCAAQEVADLFDMLVKARLSSCITDRMSDQEQVGVRRERASVQACAH